MSTRIAARNEEKQKLVSWRKIKGHSERFENITKNTYEATEVEQFAGIFNYDIQRIRQQFNQTTFRFINRTDHIFVTLSLLVTVGNILRFPVICSESGGRIGIAMLLVAICKSLILSYSVIGIFHTFKSITTVFSSLSQSTWLECVYESHSSCYDPYVKCNEAIGNYQYYSKCYNFKNDDQVLKNSNYTWEQVVIALTTTSEALREFPPNIYWMEKINKAGNISEFFIVSASIEQAIIAVIVILGIRFYAKIARFVVIFPQLCMLICIIYATAKAGSQNTLASIAEGFSPDPEKFFDLKVWITAALQAIITTNILDGTCITLAAMKEFRNNFMRSNALETRRKYILHYAIITFAKTLFGAILVSLTFFSLFLCTIGIQVVVIEMIIMSVYRTVIRIKFINQETSRNIIICVYFLLMHLYTYIYGRLAFGDIRVRYFYFSLILTILAFLELLACIHIYHLKRLIVNLHTMLGEPPNNFWRYLGYPVNLYWTACWYIITPALCIISGGLALFIIISGRLYSDIIALTVITFLPLSVIIITMIIHILKAYGTGKAIKSLFIADHHWLPELGINRQQALYEERAARAII